MTVRSTWSAPSTWSSTASPSRSRSPSSAGCCGPAAGCCCPCRRTSGRGPTTTSGPATTGGTPARGSGRRSQAAGFDVRRCTLRVRGGLPVLRGGAAGPAATPAARRPPTRAAAGLARRATGCSPGSRARRAGSCGGATCRSAHRSSWPPASPLTGARPDVLDRPATRRPRPRRRGRSSRCARSGSPDQAKYAAPGSEPDQPAAHQRRGPAARHDQDGEDQVGHREHRADREHRGEVPGEPDPLAEDERSSDGGPSQPRERRATAARPPARPRRARVRNRRSVVPPPLRPRGR